MKGLWQDIRFAFRLFAQNPSVTVVAIIALALGIGSNTAIFSVVHAVLLKPLPYREPDRIVSVLRPTGFPLSGAEFSDLKTQARSFEAMAAAEAVTGNFAGGSLGPQKTVGLRLSEGMFQLLGVHALIGRVLLSEDVQPGKDGVVVISYGLWQRRFNGTSNVIGKPATIDGQPYTVVGVMPRDFQFAPFWITQAEIWTPLSLESRVQDRKIHTLRGFARLRPEVALAAAQAEIDGICANLAKAYPDSEASLRLRLDRIDEKAVSSVRPALRMISVAVGLVLLIACSNVANLLLATTTRRRREIAVRLALGARPLRLLRQCLTESVVLSFAGAIPGLLLALWGTRALRAMLQPDAGEFDGRLFRWNEIGLDPTVVLFSLGLALLTGILFGAAPAYFATRTDLNLGLKAGGRSMAGGYGSWLRKMLVGAEVALSIVLLCGAGLLIRSFLNLRAIDPGFDANNVLTMEVSVAGQARYTGAGRETLYRKVLQEVRAVPGVRSVALINHVPLIGDIVAVKVSIEGRAEASPDRPLKAVYRAVSSQYFSTMRIPLLNGREFDDRDTERSQAVVVVNETLAKQHWPGESALGKRLMLDEYRDVPVWRMVIGVAKDVKQDEWTTVPDPETYVPVWQADRLINSSRTSNAYVSVVARTVGDAALLARPVETAIRSIDPGLPVSHLVTLDHGVANSTWEPRFNTTLMAIFACVAITLAIVGIYGVMAYDVAQRTHEVGIRMALGASGPNIVRLFLGQNMKAVIAGAAVGSWLALVSARLITSLLYGVAAFDPAVFVGVAVVVLLVAVAASLIPAWRAAEVDPATALAAE